MSWVVLAIPGSKHPRQHSIMNLGGDCPSERSRDCLHLEEGTGEDCRKY